ncbi:hypothetical protein CTI12_AA351140 [Artemisia annua]|uniref:Uncharacterized protein n=1 Tax=Artemisia annua TaxID=35608 RepID=A0A2U1MR11_ARTAN|nr:hypothetical protein CTI12_AA351140 [Artemisia annua]
MRQEEYIRQWLNMVGESSNSKYMHIQMVLYYYYYAVGVGYHESFLISYVLSYLEWLSFSAIVPTFNLILYGATAIGLQPDETKIKDTKNDIEPVLLQERTYKRVCKQLGPLGYLLMHVWRLKWCNATKKDKEIKFTLEFSWDTVKDTQISSMNKISPNIPLCSATKKDKEIKFTLEFSWDTVKGKVVNSIIAIENGTKVKNKVMESGETANKPSTLYVIPQVLRFRLIQASFHWHKNELSLKNLMDGLMFSITGQMRKVDYNYLKRKWVKRVSYCYLGIAMSGAKHKHVAANFKATFFPIHKPLCYPRARKSEFCSIKCQFYDESCECNHLLFVYLQGAIVCR